MSKISISAQVPEEFHKLIMAAMDIVIGLYEPLSDGVDISDLDDIAKIVPEALEAIQSFSGAIEGVQEDKTGAVVSAAVAVDYLIDNLVKLQKGE